MGDPDAVAKEGTLLIARPALGLPFHGEDDKPLFGTKWMKCYVKLGAHTIAYVNEENGEGDTVHLSTIVAIHPEETDDCTLTIKVRVSGEDIVHRLRSKTRAQAEEELPRWKIAILTNVELLRMRHHNQDPPPSAGPNSRTKSTEGRRAPEQPNAKPCKDQEVDWRAKAIDCEARIASIEQEMRQVGAATSRLHEELCTWRSKCQAAEKDVLVLQGRCDTAEAASQEGEGKLQDLEDDLLLLGQQKEEAAEEHQELVAKLEVHIIYHAHAFCQEYNNELQLIGHVLLLLSLLNVLPTARPGHA